MELPDPIADLHERAEQYADAYDYDTCTCGAAADFECMCGRYVTFDHIKDGYIRTRLEVAVRVVTDLTGIPASDENPFTYDPAGDDSRHAAVSRGWAAGERALAARIRAALGVALGDGNG